MKTIFIFLIGIYQKVKGFLYPYKTCVFEPTCSAYFKESIERFGWLKGLFMGLRRLSRCHAWQKNPGWDPVSDKDKHSII